MTEKQKETAELLKVFLSYSWRNSAERFALGKTLENLENCQFIYDRKHIAPGACIHQTISKLIEECDCIIVLITKDSLSSFEVRDELTRAHALAKHIVPIVEVGIETDSLPWLIRDLRQIRYDTLDFDSVVRNIEEYLKELKPLRKSSPIGFTAIPYLDSEAGNEALAIAEKFLLRIGVLVPKKGQPEPAQLEVSDHYRIMVELAFKDFLSRKEMANQNKFQLLTAARAFVLLGEITEAGMKSVPIDNLYICQEVISRYHNFEGFMAAESIKSNWNEMFNAVESKAKNKAEYGDEERT